MSGEESDARGKPVPMLDRDQIDALMLAQYIFRQKQRGGTATEADERAFLDAFSRFGVTPDQFTQDVVEAIRTNRYRGPRTVLLDETGYDRELAKASLEPGWHSFVDEAFDFVEREYPGSDLRWVQWKQKWGVLRAYWEASDPSGYQRLERLLTSIRVRSASVCETCGASGARPRKGGWISVECDEHSRGREPYPEPMTEVPATREDIEQTVREADEKRRREESGP